jgi:hypothetical protein
MPVFFDTNVIRYLSVGLANPLPDHSRDLVRLSPISATEVISQIATQPQEALGAIHSFDKWLNPDHAILLEWHESFYADRVFGVQFEDAASEHLAAAVTRCFGIAEVSDDVIEDAQQLRQFLIAAKRSKAQLLERAIRRIRNIQVEGDELAAGARSAIAAGIAERIGALPGTWTEEEVAAQLGAYFEFHTDLVIRAVPALDFNFFSPDHLNDHFDAEQLCYLADPCLHFVTCDLGYTRVRYAEQRNRIHVLSAQDLQNPYLAPGIITHILDNAT